MTLMQPNISTDGLRLLQPPKEIGDFHYFIAFLNLITYEGKNKWPFYPWRRLCFQWYLVSFIFFVFKGDLPLYVSKIWTKTTEA